MTTPARFISISTISETDFSDFKCSERTTAVDMNKQKQLAIKLLGSEVMATAVALKLNTRGLKIKPDDFVYVNGSRMMLQDVLDKLKTQDGYTGTTGGIGRDSSKEILSIVRLCRCMAANCIKLMKKGAVKNSEENTRLGDSVGLAHEYCFLNAAYGMSDDEIKKHGAYLIGFCSAFDTEITKAYNNGWASGTSKRSHEESVRSYFKWRGFEI